MTLYRRNRSKSVRRSTGFSGSPYIKKRTTHSKPPVFKPRYTSRSRVRFQPSEPMGFPSAPKNNLHYVKQKFYRYIVDKEVTPIAVRTSIVDPNDPESMIPPYFKLIPGIILYSKSKITNNDPAKELIFGIKYQAPDSTIIRDYDVKVDSSTIGKEIVVYEPLSASKEE